MTSDELLPVDDSDATPPEAVLELQYTRLFDSLDNPTRRVVSTATHGELLCPHTPPDDPDWPTPFDEVHRARMLARFPHRQRVICALTAAEMALPVWFARSPEGYDHLDPVTLLVCIRSWLEGRISHTELTMRVAWDDDFKGVSRDQVSMAAASSVAAARVAVLRDVSDVERSIAFAADACGIGWEHWPVFLEDWWRHCRCRMPFRDAPTAEIA